MVNINKQLLVALLLTISAVAVNDVKKGSQIEEFLKTIATKEAALCTFELFKDASIDPATATAQFNTYITADQRAQIKLLSEQAVPSSQDKKPSQSKVVEDNGKDVVVDNKKPASKDVVVDNNKPASKNGVVSEHVKSSKDASKDVVAVNEVVEADVELDVEVDVNEPTSNNLAIEDKAELNKPVSKVHPKSADVENKNKLDVVVPEQPKSAQPKSEKVLTASKPLTQKIADAISKEKTTVGYAIVIECFVPMKEKLYKQFNFTGICNAPDNKITVNYRKHVDNNKVETTTTTIDVQQVSQVYSLLEEVAASEKATVSFDSTKCELNIDWAAIAAVFVGILALLY